MTQALGSGTLEEVLRYLQSMFESAAYTAEINNILTQISSSQTYTVKDINGATYQFDTNDLFGGGAPSSWVKTSFARVTVTDGLKIGADNPTLYLFGQPGGIGKSISGGDFVLDQNFNPSYDYTIDGAVVTYGADPGATERAALMMADALDRLVIRNPALGGLVRYMQSMGPPTPATAKGKGGGTYGGALVRWKANIFRIV